MRETNLDVVVGVVVGLFLVPVVFVIYLWSKVFKTK